MATNNPAGPDTLIVIKISVEGSNRKFKVPFRELAPPTLCAKLRSLLELPSDQPAVFERYSDSAGGYITLDPANPAAFKTLIRAAKAKHKLRLRTVFPEANMTSTAEKAPLNLPANGSQQTLVNNPAVIDPSVVTSRPIDFWGKAEGAFVAKPDVSKVLKPVAFVPPIRAVPTKRSSVGPLPKRSSGRLDRHSFYHVCDEINRINRQGELYLGPAPVQEGSKDALPASWSVFCNACDKPMENEHFHCNICDEGDYDLCQNCVAAGIHCNGTGHWLIKRTIENGRVVSSQTMTLPPKGEVKYEVKAAATLPKVTSMPEIPGAFTDDKKSEAIQDAVDNSRTCNNCIEVLPDRFFVTCLDCEDFDLCYSCHEKNKHGHHPAHTFEPVSDSALLSPMGGFLCAPGRNVRHAALCDGCDKPIFGVRHKCLNCPDWDYCSECFKNVKFIHVAHRFVPIYDPIPEPRHNATRHFGILCDGPLCKDKHEHITGLRYKCAICDDTDFCANCEASPENRHNRTHPMIMFKTPVRNVSITTMDQDRAGGVGRTMGDQPRRSQSVVSNHAASQVQTIVDLKPSEAPAPVVPNKIKIKDLLAEPIEEKIRADEVLKPISAPVSPIKNEKLAAHYIRDTVADGSVMAPYQEFFQTWTLENPGPHAWPAGCSVRYVGGDNMLNIDDVHPTSAAHIASATESNIIARTVEVGETVSFRIAMRAPRREGTAISYWRLKTSDGFPFGHRLWCHIKVISPPPTFSSINTAREAPAPIPVSVDNFNDVLLAMRTRALAASAGHEAAKVATTEVNYKKPSVEAARKSLMEKHAELQAMMHKDGMVAPWKAVRPCVELPVERSAVELDKTVAEAKAVDAAEKGKQKVFTIPVTDSKSVVSPAVSIVSAPRPAFVEDDDQSAASSSTMIFPKLDKESPDASMLQEAEVKVEEKKPAEVAVSAVNSPAPTNTTLELFDDAESVDADDLVSSDDEEPFLTDEEYDLLDASDEEDM